MTETTRQPFTRERVRFDVLPDGTLDGDDGTDGHLAGMLRYVCRMGSQIGALIELGDLKRASTLSNLALTARVSGAPLELHIMAELAPLAQASHYAAAAVAPRVSAQELIRQALKRMTIDLGSDWAAFITDDSRLIGALHDNTTGRGAPRSLHDVGVRALAILGSLEPEIIGTAVRLDFDRASVLVAPIGGHAAFAQADNVDVNEVVRTFTAVQGLLAGAEVTRAGIVTASSPI